MHHVKNLKLPAGLLQVGFFPSKCSLVLQSKKQTKIPSCKIAFFWYMLDTKPKKNIYNLSLMLPPILQIPKMTYLIKLHVHLRLRLATLSSSYKSCRTNGQWRPRLDKAAFFRIKLDSKCLQVGHVWYFSPCFFSPLKKQSERFYLRVCCVGFSYTSFTSSYPRSLWFFSKQITGRRVDDKYALVTL